MKIFMDPKYANTFSEFISQHGTKRPGLQVFSTIYAVDCFLENPINEKKKFNNYNYKKLGEFILGDEDKRSCSSPTNLDYHLKSRGYNLINVINDNGVLNYIYSQDINTSNIYMIVDPLNFGLKLKVEGIEEYLKEKESRK